MEEIQDKALLSKIATCKKDFGYGRLKVFEYIGKSSKNPRETPGQVKALNDFKQLPQDNLRVTDFNTRQEVFSTISERKPLISGKLGREKPLLALLPSFSTRT